MWIIELNNAFFNDDELLRYSRQILLPQIDIAGQQKLRDSRVVIIGAGGLGCPVGLYLAAAGVGQITVVDGDNVELSNLQRQIAHHSDSIGQFKAVSLTQRMTAINPLTKVIAETQWLTADNGDQLIANHDVIADCSDNFATRFLINRLAVKHNKPLVSGAAIRGEGQLAVFLRGETHPCYACVYPEQDEEGETCAQAGVLAPVVGVIGCLQAVETVKVLAGQSTSVDVLTVYDAWQCEFRRLKIKRDPACPVCHQ